jgi:crotonobetainyl-CoA:carnitine CoA-transferase CaiB-like acyl-CoA transferase
VAPVNDSADILADEHLLARGELVTIPDEIRGMLTLLAPPARIDGWRRTARETGFTVGRHNDEIYRGWLGMPQERLASLIAEGVI